jgi:hypothetical protein
MRPKRLALGAATPGTPSADAACSNASATGCEGMRKPMLDCPPAAAVPSAGRRGTIRVSAPGQKCWASRWAAGCDRSPKAWASANVATCTIKG